MNDSKGILCTFQAPLNDMIVPIYTPLYDGNKTNTMIIDDLYEDELDYDVDYDDFEDWAQA